MGLSAEAFEQFILLDVEAKLVIIYRKLQEISDKMTVVDDALAKLTDEVAAVDTVDTAVEALLTTLVAQIAALKTGSTDPVTAAAIDQLTASLTAKTQALSDAVAANTPAAPTP